MKDNFEYPINPDWNVEKLTNVINFFGLIEEAFSKGVARNRMEMAYQKFKIVIPSKSEEKQIFAKYKKNSGLEPFLIIKQLKNVDQRVLKG